MADGVPARLDGPRITALGNAVVPAVAKHLGHLITAHHTATYPDREETVCA
jgi:DNA (cytosine-5)-methyltransferase 1